MSRNIRRDIYNVLLSVGLEVHRKKEPLRFLSLRNIQTVLDVGANEGQFARRARSLFPRASIYSFEPLPRVFRTLAQIRHHDSKFEAINAGLGDEPGEVDFEENTFSPSSSMLGVTQRGAEAFPFASRTNKIRVSMTTLDKWAENRRLQTPMLIKMDVQGFEDRVICGGERTIMCSDVVITEVSFVPIYKDQPLFGQIYARMCNLGFRLAGTIENLSDPRTGEILQADAIFVASRV